MNLKVISINVGRALLVSALFMFISMLVSIINGMDSAFTALSISFIITFIFGAFPFIFVRNTSAISLRDGYLIIVLSWFLSFVFGMLPYVLWGGEYTLINAWFESVSGYTTTGSTILTDVEVLPKSLLFWRSSTHFIGGLGVVVFLLLVLPDTSPFRLKLTNIEVSSLSKEGYRFRSMKIVQVVVSVYVGLVVVLTGLLMLAGMSFFDAINHAFSTISTGGFSTKNLSIAYFDSRWIEVILTIFMILSAMHLGLIFSVLATRSLKPFGSPIPKYFLLSTLVMSLMIAVCMKVQDPGLSWPLALLQGTFQLVCYITTTGYGLFDANTLPMFGIIVLIFASIQCGCSGSTCGGIKADRTFIVIKAISWQIRKRINPSSVLQIKMGKQYVRDEVAMPIFLFILVYFIVILVSFLLTSMTDMPALDSFSGVIASIGNVGPGFGAIGSMGNYADVPSFTKFIYTIDMFLGRVEIYPIFIVVAMMLKKDK